MRSVPLGSYSRLIQPLSLWNAYLKCRQGKRRLPNMAWFDMDADRHILRLHRQLTDRRYAPGTWRLRVIHDPKTRLIAAPCIRDRIVHRALLDEIGPWYERSYIAHSYTGALGRGPHRAVLQFLAWMRRYKYRLYMDISRYFPSIQHSILCDLLAHRLRDNDTRLLIRHQLKAGGEVYRTPLAIRVLGLEHRPVPAHCGLPLGSYLSQWAGTFYLDGLDHVVKRELKIQGYLRYMDDFVLFGDSRMVLKETEQAIEAWLAEHRGLALNPRHRQIQSNQEPAVFLGYRVSRSGITPSRKLRRRMKQNLRKAAARGPRALTRTVAAYKGFMTF
jgi:RNA-directed DNA polymerase